MRKKNQQTVEVTVNEPQTTEITPYDNLYANQQNEINNFNKTEETNGSSNQDDSESKKINLTFSLNSLSSILAICSLCLTFLFAILDCFGVALGLATGVFFLITSLLAIASLYFAYRNCNNRINAHLMFSVLTVLVTVLVYL